MTTKKQRNPHHGSSFESFLKEEGIYEEVTAAAQAEVIAWQLAEAMKEREMSKRALARQMGTSRATVDRLLDPANRSLTINTLARAAAALGRTVSIELR
jgi:DNA-binding Xre family transcriptional regulator